jgi:translation initiation factor IF-3
MSESKLKFPTEMVELPSNGIVYPKENPLSSGKVEMKYMTAKEEDILTNQSYIQKGTVLDKLLEKLIVSECDYKDLIVGDKNALLIAARILGYGSDYEFTYRNEKIKVDLSSLENKEFDKSKFSQGQNEFPFTCPKSNTTLTFKLLNHGDEVKIENELKGLKKINKNISADLSTRLKYMIVSVDSSEDKKDIRDFVDNYFLAQDSRAFRNHIKDFQPDVNLKIPVDTIEGGEEDITIPIGLNFFWPDADL